MIVGVRERKKEDEKKPTRYFSNKQENQVSKKLSGKQVVNSGATLFAKGDVQVDNYFLVECKTKTTHSDSMSIKKEWLEKNKKEALFMGKKFNTLAFNFGPGENNYFIIDEELFEILLDYIRKNNL